MRRIFVFLGIIMLIIGSAGLASANTIASSTMWFIGSQTDYSNHSGTFTMINEQTYVVGDGIAGFDVYAENGAWGTFDKDPSSSASDYTAGIILDHDGYQEAGGWGATYNPDCADWYNYQLTLTADSWYLEYNGNVGNDGVLTGASAAPMSGSMDWYNFFATETGTGVYYSGMGTAQDSGYAAIFAAEKFQSTAGAWDMDWSWGSDYVPLQYPGFIVACETIEGTNNNVLISLTPTPIPGAFWLLASGILGLVGIRRKFNG